VPKSLQSLDKVFEINLFLWKEKVDQTLFQSYEFSMEILYNMKTKKGGGDMVLDYFTTGHPYLAFIRPMEVVHGYGQRT